MDVGVACAIGRNRRVAAPAAGHRVGPPGATLEAAERLDNFQDWGRRRLRWIAPVRNPHDWLVTSIVVLLLRLVLIHVLRARLMYTLENVSTEMDQE
jgi:hypothetical protein